MNIKEELQPLQRLSQIKGVTPPLYEMEDLLTMLSGTDFYSMDQIQYVYYKLRGEEEEANYFLNILTNQQIALQKKLNRMKIGIDECEKVEEIKNLCKV